MPKTLLDISHQGSRLFGLALWSLWSIYYLQFVIQQNEFLLSEQQVHIPPEDERDYIIRFFDWLEFFRYVRNHCMLSHHAALLLLPTPAPFLLQ